MAPALLADAAAASAACRSRPPHTLGPMPAHGSALSVHAGGGAAPSQDLQASDFPLTTLGPRLVSFRGDVLHGIGFKVLRGE